MSDSRTAARVAMIAQQTLRSPDGRVEVTFELIEREEALYTGRGCPVWQVSYDDQSMLLPSALGIEIGGAAPFTTGLSLIRATRRRRRGSWRPACGERAEIRDDFNELTVRLCETVAPGRLIELVFRCYDAGAAVRYRIPRQPGLAALAVTNDRTTFRFPEGTDGYFEAHNEGEYVRQPITAFREISERPLTLVYPHGKQGCLFEADNADWPRMRLAPDGVGLVAHLDGPAQARTPCLTPWRALLVADRPGDLPERSDLILNLSAPCALDDTSWIQPGKVIREVTLSTEGGRACVDFAVRHGFRYVLYDAGWYGYEYDDLADATQVAPDPERTRKIAGWAGLDLPAVIRYGRDRGIGVILYVNRRALERQGEALIPLYAQWGVAGIKFGFVNVGAQEWTCWLHRLIRLAAAHKLVVNVHDAYRPVGYSRAYPNLLTQEGVRGNEHMPDSGHNCTLPFVRYPVGAADYTPCYYTPRLRNTHAHQLALPLITYSPLMHLFWYDRPSMAQDDPELDFWDHLPTTWDETRCLRGEIGEFVVVARRSGNQWFVAGITGPASRVLTVRFEDVLGIAASAGIYRLHLCRDPLKDEDGGRTGVVTEVFDGLTGVDKVSLELSANGGFAMRLEPSASASPA